MGSVGQLVQFGHECRVSLGKVDQPPQRDVDPARRLHALEVPNVVRGLGGEVAYQLEASLG